MIIGIESSCDESALALFEPETGYLEEWMHSQVLLHSIYGGVVPDLASREHLANFPRLLELLEEKRGRRKIGKIAVTRGPGLAGCLALGLALAKSLALEFDAALVGVNHLRGHAFSPFINLYRRDPAGFGKIFRSLLPHLGLIVSGGNTLLFQINEAGDIGILAQTADDAAGEALDKGAKLLGLGYPGGPFVEKEAEKGSSEAYDFPRSFYDSEELKFSFSGLKTSLRYRLEKMDDGALASALPDLCASYQEAVAQALARKTGQALERGRFASLGLSGGVANNRRLRTVFQNLAKESGATLFCAENSQTGDNAAMIAFAAHVDKEGTLPSDDFSLSFHPSLALGDAVL